MRNGLLLVLMACVALLGCTSPDENPSWNPPEQYPPPFYDRDFYLAPMVELEPTEKVGNNIPIYYSRDELVFIKHPDGQQPASPPRMGLFYSNNGGTVWNKAGYYGLQQTHFEFHAPQDDRYWIRFVGPGQGTAEVPPGQPHRVYVVDTHAPKINMTVSPSPWLDEDRKVPRQFHVGQEVVLHWTVDDKHLIKDSVQLATCYAQFPHNLVWSEFGEQMGPVGAVRVMIPPEAAHQAGLRFRIIAKDKAGNIGIALSEILPVTAEPLPESERPMIADLGSSEPKPATRAPAPLEEAQYDPPAEQPQPQPVAPRPQPTPKEAAPLAQTPEPQPANESKPVPKPRPQPIAKKPAPMPEFQPLAQPTSEPKQAAPGRRDAGPSIQRQEVSDTERRLAELKRRRDAQLEQAPPASPEPEELAQLTPPPTAPAVDRREAPRVDKPAGLQRSTQRPTLPQTTPAPLTDPIQIRPADETADVAPPVEFLEPVAVEETPRKASPTMRHDELPPVSIDPAELEMPRTRELAPPKVSPATASPRIARKDAAPDVADEIRPEISVAPPATKPQPARTEPVRQDAAPSIAAAAPAPPKMAAPQPKPAVATPQREDAAPAAQGETIAEIEARMAAARKRYQQEPQSQTDATSPRQAPAPVARKSAEPPMADVDDIAETVAEQPAPENAIPPKQDDPGEAFDVQELAHASRVERTQPASPVQSPRQETSEAVDVDVDEIERQMAALKARRDAERLAAKTAPRRQTVEKVDEGTIVQIDRPSRAVPHQSVAPAMAKPERTAADADVSPLLTPLDVGPSISSSEVASSDDALAMDVPAPRQDVTPGPVLRTERRTPEVEPVEPATQLDDNSAVIAMVDLPRPKAPLSAPGPESGSARVASLRDVPESVQQGWPAAGMTLRGGVNRLLNWLPAGTSNYTFVELQFSSDDGRKWVTVANGLRRGRAAMWNVPKISSENCRLRVLGRDGKGGESVLAVSDPFKVDSGQWESVDLSGGK